jgi:7SK snRNA methylphosphate capping enzyme
VVGVDIDGDLIRTAWKRRRLVWSLQEPPAHHDNKASPASVTSDTDKEDSAVGAKQVKKRKRMDSRADMVKGGVHSDLPGQSQPNPSPSYFPMALQHMFGPLPVPSTAVAVSATPEWKPKPFPHNITFHTADWMAAPRDMDMGIKKEDKEGYDVIVA